MSSERLWVLILTLTSFLAGMAAGILVTFQDGSTDGSRPFRVYEARLVEGFDLDAEQTRWLRAILDRYDDDIEALQARHVRDLEPDLIRIGRRCHERVRRWVLPPERRDEFDRLARGDELRPAHDHEPGS